MLTLQSRVKAHRILCTALIGPLLLWPVLPSFRQSRLRWKSFSIANFWPVFHCFKPSTSPSLPQAVCYSFRKPRLPWMSILIKLWFWLVCSILLLCSGGGLFQMWILTSPCAHLTSPSLPQAVLRFFGIQLWIFWPVFALQAALRFFDKSWPPIVLCSVYWLRWRSGPKDKLSESARKQNVDLLHHSKHRATEYCMFGLR